MSVPQLYSGVVLNQNAVPEDSLDTLPLDGTIYYQTFELPSDYVRGADDVIPDLTGFQLFLNVTNPLTASLSWSLDRFDGINWNRLVAGVTTGATQTGPLWFHVFFDNPVAVNPTWLSDTFRLAIVEPGIGASTLNYSVPNPLSTGQAFTGSGLFPSVILYPGSLVYISDTETMLTDNGRSISLMFRILAAVADSGTDFLGNTYRSAVVTSQAANASPVVLGGVTTYWLSQPNPSAFAVESMYLDMRERGSAIVADRFTLDPITPGVAFHVYYSNDPGGPGTTTPSWEALLWTPVYKTFVANRRTTYALPEPITAKYIKVEFSNLQAHAYNPGDFQIPSTFKKYPMWVLDYFTSIFGQIKPDLMASGVNVVYDALDLAFNYYSGDILQDPAAPALAKSLTAQQARFIQQEVFAEVADATSLSQINVDFQPFTSQPALMGASDSVLANYTSSTATDNQSSEDIQVALGNTSIVSNLQREALLVEKGFPLMFFYLPCRHAYRVVEAMFESNIGYFAGVNSLLFHRETYTGRKDRLQINENLGDGTNLLINDWIG